MAAAAAAILVGGTASAAQGAPMLVSHGDPFAGCAAGAESGTNYPGAEVEPSLTEDLLGHTVVGAFQQDRWSDGGAKGLVAVASADGGRHFTETPLPFTVCAPGGLPYERASDPWLSTGPDGTVYASGLVFDVRDANNGVVAAVSHDGGRTWTHTTRLIDDTQIEFGDDKNSVTADPVRPGTAYQVWDRLDTGPGNDGSRFLGPALLAVTHDFGASWSAPKVIVDTVANQQTIGNIVTVDPRTHTLYDVFDLITYTDPSANTVVSANISIVRSTDGGATWSAPRTVAPDTSITDVDPNTGAALRTANGIPEVAIDRLTGELYVAYEGTDFTAGAYDQAQLTHSTDGGATWSAPVRVNGAPKAEAFTPSVAVALDGTVAVSYYDLRDLRPGNTTTLPTRAWLTTSPRGGERFGAELALGPGFDLMQAPNAGGLFLGDYEGLVAGLDSVRTLFVATNSGQPDNRTDVFTESLPVGDDAGAAPAADRGPVAAQAMRVGARSHLRR
ncbi:sialidase family protein [Solihabitans fulvus]|nr:sialidase family protein [Solihabitans fulvus]